MHRSEVWTKKEKKRKNYRWFVFIVFLLVRQGILHLRRVVSHIQNSSDPQLISKSWVEIARSARGDGQLEAARSALIQALSVDPKCVSALVEHARLLYIQGQRQTAIMQIEQVIKANSADKSAASGFSAKKQRAKSIEQRVADCRMKSQSTRSTAEPRKPL